MSSLSTYQLRNSLPARKIAQRPRRQSMSEYQPLSFDREAIQAAYQRELLTPSVASSSSYPSFPTTGPSSVETRATDVSGSTLSHHLKPGDNPHSPPNASPPNVPVAHFREDGNNAGLGAGHSLSPPGSPMHELPRRKHRLSLMSDGDQSSVDVEMSSPPLPPRPLEVPESTFFPSDVHQNPPPADYGFPPMASGSEAGMSAGPSSRALPRLPTNIPAPELPAWEPDLKSHIPASLTQSSIQHAYAQLGAPPPGLPPRRVQPAREVNRQRSDSRRRVRSLSPDRFQNNRYTTRRGMGLAAAATAQDPDGDVVMNGQRPLSMGDATPLATPSTTFGPISPQSPGTPMGNRMRPPGESPTTADGRLPPPPLPTGAPDYPPGVIPDQPKNKPVRQAETSVTLESAGKKPIWSTHFLDPALRDTLVTVPHQMTNIANVALSTLSSGPKTRYNSTTGAPIDGMAKMAKGWFVKPDAVFTTEAGAVELGIGIIDCGGEQWGKDKGRKRARVEVHTKSGGIKMDLIEVDEDRQVDLKIETKSGDVLLIIPETYEGPIHVTSPQEPQFLDILQPQLQPMAHPYETFYTTYVTPLNGARDPTRGQNPEHTTASKLDKWMPKSLKGKNDYLDQVVGGFAAHTRGEQSKISIQSNKGRVVVGYRETRDEEQARTLNLKVGVEQLMSRKKKRWWQ